MQAAAGNWYQKASLTQGACVHRRYWIVDTGSGSGLASLLCNDLDRYSNLVCNRRVEVDRSLVSLQ